MKKLLIKGLVAASVIALSGLTLTSCGGDEGITFWHTMGQQNQKTLNRIIEEFNKIEGNGSIKIKHTAQGDYDGLYDKLIKAIPAKTTPVMAFCYPDHVADYLDAGAVVNLDTLMNDPEIGYTSTGKDPSSEGYDVNEDANDFIPAFLQEGQEYAVDGTFSLPFSKSTEVMFYNETYLKKNGFVDADGNAIVPTKWENEQDPNDYTAMINLCRAIKAKDSKIKNPLGYDSDDNMYITLSKQLDIPYTSINEEGVGSFDFENQQAKDMVAKVKGWYDEGLIKTKGTIEGNSYTSTLFKNEQLIFSIGSTGGTSYNVPNKDSDGIPDFEAQVAPIPTYGEDVSCISQGPSICFFKNAKISEEDTRMAFKFYKFLTNSANSAAYSILTGYEPVRASSFNTKDYQDHLNKETPDLFTKVANITVTLQDNYFTSPAFVGSATARPQVGGIITQVCLGNKTIDKAFNDAMTKCLFAAM